ncbi:NAD(+)/NADH kinase [Fusibacter sp. JL298sf-3]
MDKVLIHANSNSNSQRVRRLIIKSLTSKGKKVVKQNPDIIFVIGGDGTMLSAVRRYKDLGVPFMGIDTGTLGFLTTIMPNNLDKIFDVLDRKDYRVMSYPLLMVSTKTLSGDIFTDYAFNEIIIKHVDPKLMEAKVYFNGRAFNYFTGDGFIISTPMGATGYAIWAGGAVMHSDLPVYQITPITPNDNSVNRPMSSTMILPSDTKIDIKIVKASKRKVIVACDGHKLSNDYIEDIHIKISEETEIKVIRSDDFDYFDLFKRKIIDKNIRRVLD